MYGQLLMAGNMDNSFDENDMSLSPSQILERLQVLRQLQLLQRSKLQQQRLDYETCQDESNSVTEIISHFTSSTSYNTFRNLLNDSESNSEIEQINVSQKIRKQDLIEGVSVLNLSQESEFIITSPGSSNSQLSVPSKNENEKSSKNVQQSIPKCIAQKYISLDEMPILSPKKDFEKLVVEKIQAEKSKQTKIAPENVNNINKKGKKPFLRKGACMARFGLRKNDLVIQNTKSLPWAKRSSNKKSNSKSKDQNKSNANEANPSIKYDKTDEQKNHVKFCETVKSNTHANESVKKPEIKQNVQNILPKKLNNDNDKEITPPENSCNISNVDNKTSLDVISQKQHRLSSKGKTWAAIMTKEQDEFLRKLKQSEYYRNFDSPTKSAISDYSCDENYAAKQERESAEQKIFNLLESKTCQQSFDINSSFIHKFLKSNLESSGESTPLIMQKCVENNPKLLHIDPLPETNKTKNVHVQNTLDDICDSEYTDCDETSTCCSCNTVEEYQQCNHDEINTGNGKKYKSNSPKIKKKNDAIKNHDDKVTEDNTNSNMEDTNAKLVATSELLKERLKELEDEIDTFRKENSKLVQMREEIDLERQKIYEEKSAFEQKFNEEKILAEYYLAEEKEKLSKQKQTYERYVREMRGRLNKKEKDEIINLKKEISDLKEDIRLKDAKSTSTIARLRNQIKILEKEKKELEEAYEKLKKENKRIQHSNEITRRMSNLKYLEQINRKLNSMAQSQSNINIDKDIKYRAFEIERQSRTKKKEVPMSKTIHKRAKSVPNLNVTSRYAKYFSQRDVVSHMERNNTINNIEPLEICSKTSDDEALDFDIDDYECSPYSANMDEEKKAEDNSHGDANNLERIYIERFKSVSPPTTHYSSRSNAGDASSGITVCEKSDDFFLQKPLRSRNNSAKSVSPTDRNIQTLPQSTGAASRIQSTSPRTILSCRSPTIEEEPNRESDQVNSSESRKNVTKTNLNPIESKKADGTRELRFPNGNVKYISADGTYSKFIYYNGDIKETFYSDGRIKYFYSDTKTYHTTHADGLEVLEFPDGQVEKRYKDGSTEIRLPNGSIRYSDPKNEHVREEWRFPDGTVLTVASNGEQRVRFLNGQVEVHTKDHKRREFPDGTVKLVYNDGTSETRYSSGRVRVKDRHRNLIMDSASR